MQRKQPTKKQTKVTRINNHDYISLRATFADGEKCNVTKSRYGVKISARSAATEAMLKAALKKLDRLFRDSFPDTGEETTLTVGDFMDAIEAAMMASANITEFFAAVDAAEPLKPAAAEPPAPEPPAADELLAVCEQIAAAEPVAPAPAEPAPAPVASDVVDAYYLADVLKIDRATVYNRAHAGKLPTPRMAGRKMTWLRADLIQAGIITA